MRIVIELKRGEQGLVVLNNLYKLTPMQTTFGVINLAIVNGQPKVLSLMELLRTFVEHRVDVVRRRTQYELRQAEARAHILEGLQKALDHIDEIIKLIRAAKTTAEAREGLIASVRIQRDSGQGHSRDAVAAPDQSGAAEDRRRIERTSSDESRN